MKLKKRPIFIIAIAAAALAAVGLVVFLAARQGGESASYQFTETRRGPLQVTIASTGAISAQKTVDVGTQVSGRIDKIYVDFNDRVSRGRILARLDTTLLELAVQSAAADQLKATAQYDLKLKDYNHNFALHEKQLISDYDLESSRVEKDNAYAARVTAEVNLSKAKINLDYAVIKAPIDGVIINRTVEEGQTVAASLSAPILFTIAEDLARVRIKTYVAESDIGSVKPGQNTTFTVTAYPDDLFKGKVDIIHLQSETVQNVVNYVVMVSAANQEHKLMPGMTATVTFIVDERKDALLVSNAALAFRPAEAALAQFMADRRQELGDGLASPSPGRANSPPPSPLPSPLPARERFGRRDSQADGSRAGPNANLTPEERAARFLSSLPPNVKILWGLDESGRLTALPVVIGISDGKDTEIISHRVAPGMKFITGLNASGQGNSQRGNPRPFFFR